MKHPEDESDFDPDDPLDEVAIRLRDEAVPPTPDELVASSSPNRASRMANKVIVALFVVAATLLMITRFQRASRNVDPRSERVAQRESPVTVTPVAQLAPYYQLESDLNEIEQEIAELRRRAELLDVYRRTESLLAKN